MNYGGSINATQKANIEKYAIMFKNGYIGVQVRDTDDNFRIMHVTSTTSSLIYYDWCVDFKTDGTMGQVTNNYLTMDSNRFIGLVNNVSGFSNYNNIGVTFPDWEENITFEDNPLSFTIGNDLSIEADFKKVLSKKYIIGA